MRGTNNDTMKRRVGARQKGEETMSDEESLQAKIGMRAAADQLAKITAFMQERELLKEGPVAPQVIWLISDVLLHEHDAKCAKHEAKMAKDRAEQEALRREDAEHEAMLLRRKVEQLERVVVAQAIRAEGL